MGLRSFVLALSALVAPLAAQDGPAPEQGSQVAAPEPASEVPS